MRKDVDIEKGVENVFKNYSSNFGPYFTTKVMAKIDRLNDVVYASGLYDKFFKRLMLGGVAAVAAMLVLAFVMHGSLSVDTLLGVSDLEMENAIALSINE